MAAVARVGCSGWHYASWAGTFYDAALPKARWLETYSREFDTVELNNSFYRLPTALQFRRWRDAVPRGFLFAVKASRFLTHLKRLRDPEQPLHLLMTRASELQSTLGPILYQLPPRWVPDEERLRTFLEALPRRLTTPRARVRLTLRHVLEFRDPRGYDELFLDLLRERDVTMCVHDMRESASPRALTNRLVYVRFHGYGVRYGGSYPTRTLKSWAAWLKELLQDGIDAFAYFNNDADGHAVSDARRLRDMLSAWIPSLPSGRLE
jgi:uncharacterized protein YecE (DUF72 family)